jgi:hypothetical protein
MNPTTSKQETLDETSAMASLKLKIKAAEPEIRNYVAALEKENLKLQKQKAKLQAENTPLINRITALNEQAKIPSANIEINL